MNDFVRGISFSHEDKIHEHTQESLLLGRRTKGNLASCLHSFFQVFEKGFLQKISYFNGKAWPIKAFAFEWRGKRCQFSESEEMSLFEVLCWKTCHMYSAFK